MEEGEPKPNQIKLRSMMFCCDVPFKIAFHGQTLAGRTEPWAEFSTLEVAAYIPCTYCPVLQYNLT